MSMSGDGISINNPPPRPPATDPTAVRRGHSWSEFDEQRGLDFSEYWRLAVKHHLLILGVLAAALVLSLAVTMLMTPIYTARATLQIDRDVVRVLDSQDESPRDNLVSGEEFFQTQYGVLKSRTLAESVVDSLGLANSDAFFERMNIEPPKRGGGTAAAQIAGRRTLAIAVVRKNLTVTPVRSSRLVTIAFDSPDPQTAALIVNAFATNFIQSNLDRRFQSSLYARQFLEERIAQTKSKLEESERQLVAYASQQQIISLDSGTEGASQSLVASNLSALNSALAQAKTERVDAEQKWLQARSASLLTLPDVLQNSTIQRMTEERARLNAQYQHNSSAYRPEWPAQQQLMAQITELDEQINTLANGILQSIRTQYVVALGQENALQSQVDRLTVEIIDLRNRTIQYNIIQREVDTSRILYDGLLQRYKEVGITGAVSTNNISIVDEAVSPSNPSKPRLIINLAVAALLGLALGVFAAFVLEALDETLATPEDVEAKLGVAALGVIPMLDAGTTPLESLDNPRAAFSEAYYSLRTALQFSTPNGAPSSMLVTSSMPGEGKSTTAYATALNLARIGKRVLLVDGDLRNPSMHRLVGADNERGMTNLLSGAAKLGEVAMPTAVENLWFIPCGPLPPNPAELWGSDRLRRVLAEAAQGFDHVIIDGPPVLGFADAPIVASSVEGTLFVLESRKTRRSQARGGLRRLLMGNGHLLGFALTKFNPNKANYGGYDYAYDYHYGTKDAPPDRAAAVKR